MNIILPQKTNKYKDYNFLLTALLTLSIWLALHILFMILSGKNFLSDNFYNSFALQAEAWLNGRLELSGDYVWLELAIKDSKYYVSFPPFPSYLMVPFVALFGASFPDTFIAIIVAGTGIVYALKTAFHFDIEKKAAAFLVLFLYTGTSVWQITVDSWVWFIAQNMSLSLMLMAFHYAITCKKGKAAFFTACAMGCRPFSIIYLPLLIYIVYKRTKGRSKGFRLYKVFLASFHHFLPAVAVVFSYMLLNYMRFGNIFEFGHNYLPEFTSQENGQFSIHYLWNNIGALTQLPEIIEGALKFDMFGKVNIFIAFPFYIITLWLTIECIVKGEKIQKIFLIFTWGTIVTNIFFLLLHRTMGGAHFGNRYIIETLPAAFVCTAFLWNQNTGQKKIYRAIKCAVFSITFIFGAVICFKGVLDYYNLYV